MTSVKTPTNTKTSSANQKRSSTGATSVVNSTSSMATVGHQKLSAGSTRTSLKKPSDDCTAFLGQQTLKPEVETRRLPMSRTEVTKRRTTSAGSSIDERAIVLAGHLERFHRLVAAVGGDKVEQVKQRTEALLEYVLPRLAQLGKRVGLKIIGSVKTGSIFDGTKVIDADDVDVFILFDPSQVCNPDDSVANKSWRITTVLSEPGYVSIPLPTQESSTNATGQDAGRAGHAIDKWKFGRSSNRKYLSPVTVSRTMYNLLERVAYASRDTPTAFKLLPLAMEHDRSPIIVSLDQAPALRVNLIPACAVCGSADGGSSAGGAAVAVTYVIARPYQRDMDPCSDRLWRLSTADRELRVLDSADRADRGIRRKAICILKALVKLEPTLSGLSSYHVRTAAMYVLDSAVDLSPGCWQRQSTSVAFLELLSELGRMLADGRMPHFFFRRFDLLDGIEARTVDRWRSRVKFLIENGDELERVLRRRVEERQTRPTAALTWNDDEKPEVREL